MKTKDYTIPLPDGWVVYPEATLIKRWANRSAEDEKLHIVALLENGRIVTLDGEWAEQTDGPNFYLAKHLGLMKSYPPRGPDFLQSINEHLDNKGSSAQQFFYEGLERHGKFPATLLPPLNDDSIYELF